MLYSAGLDALSFTLRADSDESRWVHEMYDKYIQQDAATGNDLKNMGRHGFDGVGTKHLYMGSNGKHDFFETKSAYADDVANELKAVPVKMNVTRLDWSVTFAMQQKREEYANLMRVKVREAQKDGKQKVPGRCVLFESENDGNTLYIHTSDRSLVHRTYNKAAESPGEYPDDAWRHEMQQRHVRAKRAWLKFAQAPSSGWLARSYVMGFLLQYGIDEDWMKDTEPCASPSKATKSDTERRLQWFESSVVPVVEKLLAANVRQSALIALLRNAGMNITEG
jgi:hypothetical protein